MIKVVRDWLKSRTLDTLDQKPSQSAPPNSGPSKPDTTERGELVRALCSYLAENSHGRFTVVNIDPGASLCDRGYLDSLSYVAFLVHIEKTYGLKIADHELTGRLTTIDAVADHICHEASRACSSSE